ncbi:MAG TPA: hypothetical protein DDW16_01065, partial [Clostridiales bacterium]|nr:hypothetical protein [Clostridiales bacterium]
VNRSDGKKGFKAENYTSYITLSINPSFSILTDENGTVNNVVADNYDGEIVLSDLTFTNENYKTVIEKIISSCKKSGYIDSTNAISVEIACKNQKNYSKIEQEIQNAINSVVSGNQNAVEIKEKNQELLKELAKTLDDAIDDNSDLDKIFKALKNQKGFIEQKQGEKENNEFSEKTEKILNLLLVNVILDLAEELSECFEELEEIKEDKEIDTKELLKRVYNDKQDDDDILNAKKLLAEIQTFFKKLGKKDVLILTVEGYEKLKESYTFKMSEDEIEEMAEKIEDVLEDADEKEYQEVLDSILKNENVKKVFDELKEELGDDLNLSLLLQLEKESKNYKNERK